MAQLPADCFAFGGQPQSVDAALALIAASVACSSGTEHLPLTDVDGRVLASDVMAPVDLPPFANPAVDGYAVRLEDLAYQPHLPLSGRLAAGSAADPLPPGADTVLMQQDVRRQAAASSSRRACKLAPTRARRARTSSQARALLAGMGLRPQHLALAAALGQ